ncbi:glycosyltransferase family 4 protein [Candidatus Dependentiae bacterium]|nr:glycosyltransferase family 4 protein [Candidatus Dependentiae bacterium]
MKKILIIFPDEWVAYSPTILNFIECFKKCGETSVIAFDTEKFSNKDKLKEIEYIDLSGRMSSILNKLHLKKIVKIFLVAGCIIKLKLKHKYDLAVGVDSIGYFTAKLFFNNPVFLSLEICNDLFFKVSKVFGIKNIVIQTEERKKFLFGDNENIKTFYFQNSPIIDESVKIRDFLGKRRNIIYLGNFIPSRGTEFCVQALYKLTDDYTLTFKGTIENNYKNELIDKYKDLIESRRLMFDEEYLNQSELIQFLSEYYVGLCVYDLSVIKKSDFNYLSCPSGKLFNYYAAGIPVIGSDIIGLNSVIHYKTGILLKKLLPNDIAEAIKKIELNYKMYFENCIYASRVFDFKKSFEKFAAELLL